MRFWKRVLAVALVSLVLSILGLQAAYPTTRGTVDPHPPPQGKYWYR